ncbi:MAG: RNA-binding domain-containing protein [bacterium]
MKKSKLDRYPFGTSEGVALEFKRATDRLPSNFFDTVCAFLNMDGGLIVLGVEDDGLVSGLNPAAVTRIKTDIANLSNNPQKLAPPYLLFPHEEQIAGKWIIQVQVPSSSQVHEVDATVFLRSEDGDYRIKGLNRLAGLMNRKLSFFTEQRVLPFLDMSDLDPKLFKKARKLMLGRMPQHPWAGLAPEELLKVAGFVRKDYFTGKPGYTLAAALMFGYDTTIQSAAPGYKFDALLRRRDTERYDDRLTVRTNLIDAFDLLMGFVEKHLNDPFYMEGVTSVSLRSIIFRELVANIIAHREYTSAAPATMMIYRDRVEFKNPNVPHYHGRIDLNRFTPYPKNPTICRFMVQLGRYEELGSGVRKVNKYLPYYTPGAGKPVFEDGDMFTVTVPVDTEQQSGAQSRDQSGAQSRDQSGVKSGVESDTQSVAILRALELGPCSTKELVITLAMKSKTGALKRSLQNILNYHWVEYTIPDKPNSRLQKYRLTAKGRAALARQGVVAPVGQAPATSLRKTPPNKVAP